MVFLDARLRGHDEGHCASHHSPPVTPAKVLCPGGLAGWNRCRPRHLVCQGAPRTMQVKLHANATTTPKIRTYIQQSTLAVAALTDELGVSETTTRRWRGRGSVASSEDRRVGKECVGTCRFRG